MGYTVLGELGRGRRHRVVRARRDEHADVVALKCPLQPAGVHPSLLVESTVLARVLHPHVVPLVEVVSIDEERSPVALALGLADGGTLSDLAAEGPLPARSVAPVARAVASALAAVHGAGFIHGDVKPANVLLARDGVPWLADFDAATPRQPAPAGMHRRFSPPFAAPELRNGDPVDERSDVWSLGAVVERLLDPGSASAPALGAVFRDATATDPTGRPPAEELVRRLDDAFPPAPFPLPRHHRTGDDAPTCEWGPPPVRTAPPAPAAARRPRAAVVACGGLALAGAGLAVAWTVRERPVDASCVVGSGAGAVQDGQPLVADIDGRGCVTPISWSSRQGVVTVEHHDGVRRYAVGEPGDVLLIGDWDGDGRASPAVYRPSDGQVHLFDGWAGDGEVVSSTELLTTNATGGTPTVVQVGGRDVVHVEPGVADAPPDGQPIG